jgi:hypothetical protein
VAVLVPTNTISAVAVPAVSATSASTVGPAADPVFAIALADPVAADRSRRRAVRVAGVDQVVAIVVLAVRAADLRILGGSAQAGWIGVV